MIYFCWLLLFWYIFAGYGLVPFFHKTLYWSPACYQVRQQRQLGARCCVYFPRTKTSWRQSIMYPSCCAGSQWQLYYPTYTSVFVVRVSQINIGRFARRTFLEVMFMVQYWALHVSRSENKPLSPPWHCAAQTSTHSHTRFPRDSAAACFVQQRTRCDQGIRRRGIQLMEADVVQFPTCEHAR